MSSSSQISVQISSPYANVSSVTISSGDIVENQATKTSEYAIVTTPSQYANAVLQKPYSNAPLNQKTTKNTSQKVTTGISEYVAFASGNVSEEPKSLKSVYANFEVPASSPPQYSAVPLNDRLPESENLQTESKKIANILNDEQENLRALGKIQKSAETSGTQYASLEDIKGKM